MGGHVGGGGNGGRGASSTTHVISANGEELHVHMENVATKSGGTKTIIETTKPYTYKGGKYIGAVDYSPQGTRMYIGDKTIEGKEGLRRALVNARNEFRASTSKPSSDANLRQWNDSWNKETGKY